MTLIKSISGIRGTIGDVQGENLTPIDVVKYTSAYGAWVKQVREKDNYRVVIGRDARISGEMIQQLVMNTLVGMGIHVINLGLSTTPTVEMAVPMEHADGGIILTASHNPKQWNALKLLNAKGEFLSASEGEEILRIANEEAFEYSPVDELGADASVEGINEFHIKKVIDLPLVDVESIRAAGFRVAIDCVNSVGGTVLPELLRKLGVQ